MYKIERINDDQFRVIGAKEFTFTRTIGLAKELQSVELRITEKLINYLAERGETIANTKLRVERRENGKLIVDESNLEALKKAFEQPVTLEIINEVIKKQIDLDMDQFLIELKLDKEEAEQFGREFILALSNGVKENTPRE